MCEPPLCAVASDRRMQRHFLRQTIAITGGRTTAMKHRRNPPWKRFSLCILLLRSLFL
ncbi:hypothetical protein Hanom_Chr08g00716251 [Helianthus anomalus]